jgi:hypothetical protein
MKKNAGGCAAVAVAVKLANAVAAPAVPVNLIVIAPAARLLSATNVTFAPEDGTLSGKVVGELNPAGS